MSALYCSTPFAPFAAWSPGPFSTGGKPLRFRRLIALTRHAGRSILLLAVAGLAACATTGPRIVHPGAPPAEASTLAGRAVDALHAGRPARAAEDARRALKLDPHLAAAHEVLALLAMLQDDGPTARRHLLAALADGRSRRARLHLQMLSLWGMDRPEELRFAGLLRSLMAEHADPRTRAAARRKLVTVLWRRGEIEEARKVERGLHMLRSFWGIAGFDNEQSKGFDTPHGPELEVELDRAYPTSRGRAQWRRIGRRGIGPDLDLQHDFYPFVWNVAYLLTYVQAAQAGPVDLVVHSSEPIKIWLNDRNVLATREIHGRPRRPFVIRVDLSAGYNKLLVKSAQRRGPWRVGLAFRRLDGSPLALRQSPSPQAYRRDRRAPLRQQARSQGEALLARWTAGASRSFWSAVELEQRGLRGLALGQLEDHLDRYPKDPMALLWAAVLHQRSGQLQAAALAVQRGLRLPASYRLRFLLERARLFRRRGQRDRALEILDLIGKAQRASKAVPGEGWVAEQARLLAAKGWHLDRCRLAKRVLHRRPEWSWAHELAANCTRSLGRPLLALRHLERAVQLRPTSLGYRSRLARGYLAQGRCHAAIGLQRRSVKLFPDEPWERLRLGDLERRCGRGERALEAYRLVAARIPAWGRPLRQEGLVHYEAGRNREAVAAWKQALAKNPDDSNLWDRVNRLSPDRDPILDGLRPGRAALVAAVRAARGVRPIPGASVVWLLDDEASRLMPDGTLKRVVTIVRMAVDRAGRDSLGEVRLPSSGLVKVLDAFVIDRRGRRVEVTSMRGRTVRYPTLKEGSVVVLQYRHIRYPSGYLRQHLTSSWYFQHPLGQVARARWVLALPKARKLNVYVHGDVKHRVERRGGLAIHQFEARDVPPLRPESRSLPTRDLLRSVTVSTVPSWDYFSAWGRSLTSEVFEMTPQLLRTLTRITKGAKTVSEKVARVYAYALTEVRYQQDYESFIAGVKPHPAAVVLARGYGDCKDKSVLIIAMLRKLGIKAHLALIRTRRMGRVLGKIPSQQFNHAVAFLPKQAGVAVDRFLDATAENLDIGTLRGDVQGTTALVLFPGGHRLIPVAYQKPDRNSIDIELALKLAADGVAKGNLTLRLQGHQAGALRKPLQNQQILRQYAQSLVHRVYPGSKLEQAQVHHQRTILKPLLIQLSARFDDAAQLEDGALRLRLPKLLSWSGLAPWTERRHPVFLGPPAQSVARVDIALPEGASLRSKPADMSVRGACLQATGRWTYEAQTRVLHYEQRVVRSCTLVAVKDYAAFRGQVDAIERALQREAVIDKAGAKGKTPAKKAGAKGKRPRKKAGAKRKRPRKKAGAKPRKKPRKAAR